MPVTSRSRRLWRIAQLIAVLALSGVFAGLITWPETTLDLVWNVVIPLVPASLLLSPALWRNVCPLATVHMALNSPGGRRLKPPAHFVTGTVAFALLFLLVPARRFLFNTNAMALAATIAAVLVVAILLGAVFEMKAGFCNAVCPVLSVERLYGQRPLLDLGNPRCAPCTLCTVKGCIDLSPARSVDQVLGESNVPYGWLGSGFGIFAASFPGFVLGYFTTTDVPFTEGGSVYGHVAAWTLGSLAVTATVVRVFAVDAARAIPILAGAAVGLYYWFAAENMSATLHLGSAGTVAIRVATGMLLLYWLIRQHRRS